jgi:hypothetical protein
MLGLSMTGKISHSAGGRAMMPALFAGSLLGAERSWLSSGKASISGKRMRRSEFALGFIAISVLGGAAFRSGFFPSSVAGR